jgi:hypothetical protein
MILGEGWGGVNEEGRFQGFLGPFARHPNTLKTGPSSLSNDGFQRFFLTKASAAARSAFTPAGVGASA